MRLMLYCIIAGVIAGGALNHPVQAGVWNDLTEWYLLINISGGGQYVGFKRNIDAGVRNFPLEVISDGYKMVRVYRDVPDVYMVEWVWQMTIKSRTTREVKFKLEYKLLDPELFFVASSHEPVRTIAPGQTITVEKKDILPYEKIKRAGSSNWYIQLQ
jgi:hypothetical protein